MIVAIAVLTMIPAGYMTVRMMRQSLLESQINSFVHHSLDLDGTQVISRHLYGDSVLQVVTVARKSRLSKRRLRRKS